MRIPRRIASAGAGVATALVISLVPMAASAAAGPAKPDIKLLDQQSNTAVDASTELDCMNHTLTAKVTNKLDNQVTPIVTMNDMQPTLPPTMPINPGKTGNYFFDYSGNNMLAKVDVRIDGYAPVELTPMLYCSEPVSFMVTGASKSAVVGTLTNNSSFVSQVVLTRVNASDVHVENMQPGESRMIALPFDEMPGETSAFINIGTATGFQSNYSVDLEHPPVTPPGRIQPLPLNKQ
jgi:hypothetical protein